VSTLAQIRANVEANLNDNQVFFEQTSVNASIQDAYNEVAAKCRCIIKSTNLAQQANKPYYAPLALGVTDYMGVIGIYNNDTSFWLRDDISLRDFDRIRRDWEIWAGEPQFWAPHSLAYFAVTPNLSQVTGANTFTLWYWGTAPSLSTDASVPLIAADMQSLLEDYATADQLEAAEEVSKAQPYWQRYMMRREQYKERCIKSAKYDLLMRL